MILVRSLLRRLGKLLTDLGEPPRPAVLTNRDQLLRVEARTEGDACDAFTESAGIADCASDGHYLCMECARLHPDERYYRKHGEWPAKDHE